MIDLLLEATRLVGATTRRIVFRANWEESNDGVDSSLGIVICCLVLWALVAIGRKAF